MGERNNVTRRKIIQFKNRQGHSRECFTINKKFFFLTTYVVKFLEAEGGRMEATRKRPISYRKG
jgi:hypothetical protein